MHRHASTMRLFRVLLVLGPMVIGCASNIPRGIREAPMPNPTFADVRAAPEDWIGKRVRWGGSILAVHNRERTPELKPRIMVGLPALQ